MKFAYVAPLVLILALASCRLAKKPKPHDPAPVSGGSTETDKNPSPKVPPELGEASDPSDPADVSSTRDTLSPHLLVLAPQVEECNAPRPKASAVPALRRLIKDEYQNSIRDLFGLTADYTAGLPPDAQISGYSNLSAINGINADRLLAFFNNARIIANEVTAKFKAFVGCDVIAGEPCAGQFLDKFGTRIWRRPLSTEERASLLAIYKTSAPISPQQGMAAMIRSMLVSPHFLYRAEVGTAKNLDPYEMASALSYFFWSAPPDEALLALAAKGTLLEDSTLLAQAKRLMASPKSKAGLSLFLDVYTGYRGVFEGSKDAVKYKQFTDAIRSSLANESVDTFDYYVRTKNAKFSDLFTWDTTVGDPKLAVFYGVAALKVDNLDMINHKPTPRRGLLGLASLLSRLGNTTETHPVRRGEFVIEHLLCDKLTPLPVALDIKFPDPNPKLTTRERFAQHTSNAACASCHLKLDGAGFGMEDYDAIGLFRTTDGPSPVNASGKLFDLDGQKEVEFTGVAGLTKLVASSQRAQRCFALQAFQFAEGRLIKKPEPGSPQFEQDKDQLLNDVCRVRSLADEFVKTNSGVAELFIKILTHPIYRKRGE